MATWEEHWKQQFNTKLSAQNEKNYQNWVVNEGKRRGRDMSEDTIDYDLRGYWKGGGYKDKSGKGHMTDQYKKPNHPTFSTESQYNGTPDGNGGTYQGGVWGEDSFTPSKYMLENFRSPEALQQYFDRVEPGMKILWPKQ